MTGSAFKPAHRSVEGLVPYQAGRPIEEVAREMGISRVVKLASNENPLGASPRARAAAAAALDALNRYPDGGAYELRRRLAERHRVAPERIVLGNGSNDLLELLCQLLLKEGEESVYAWPAFIVYRLGTMAHGGKCVEVPLDRDYRHDLPAMAAAVTPRTRLVFISNPNNPTGTYVREDELLRFLDRVPPTVLTVLDEAYFEYARDAEGFPDGVWLAREGRPVAVLRTFSKAYGLAGLRVGYAVMPEALAQLVNRIRQPFNVNSVAQAAAAAALDDQAFVEEVVRLNSAEMQRVGKALGAMGLRVVPSAANFLLVELGGRDGGVVYERLLRAGVIVRPMAPYGLPGTVRVTIGLPEENDLFLDALPGALA